MSSSASTTSANPVVGSWSCLSEHVPLKEATEKGHIKGRSSHASGIVGDNLYVFSGENTPRVPIDNSLHVFNLSSKKWTELSKKDGQSWPVARIGHAGATSGNAFYISGGRSGLDAGDVTLDDFWKYDTVSGTWTCLTDSTGTKPPPLSYHTMTTCGDSIFIFGGCTADHGRSNGLYQYSTLTNTWSELSPVGSSSAPCARGGPGLAADDANVYVAFGYNGKEEQDDLWKFDRTNKSWAKVEPNGQKPTPRSVTDLVALKDSLFVFGGEFTPSAQGHDGSGIYVRDAYLYSPKANSWSQIDSSDSSVPVARGWFNTIRFTDSSVVVMGGFDGDERRNDVYVWKKQE